MIQCIPFLQHNVFDILFVVFSSSSFFIAVKYPLFEHTAVHLCAVYIVCVYIRAHIHACACAYICVHIHTVHQIFFPFHRWEDVTKWGSGARGQVWIRPELCPAPDALSGRWKHGDTRMLMTDTIKVTVSPSAPFQPVLCRWSKPWKFRHFPA